MEETTHSSFFGKKGIYDILHLLILVLSLFLVISISIDTFKNIPFYTQTVYMKVQLWICVLFLFDFLLEFILADRKWNYFISHFLFLLVAIPYQNIIAYMGWTFSPEVTYMIRFIPLIRGGYALAMVVGWFTFNRAASLFLTYLVTLLATVYFASLAFYVTELQVNPLVTKYTDALWWAFMDVTTVGSNIVAVTPTGRVLSVLLAALGMMMFPIFTVYITSLIQKRNQEKDEYYKNKKAQEEKKEAELAAKAAQAVQIAQATHPQGATVVTSQTTQPQVSSTATGEPPKAPQDTK